MCKLVNIFLCFFIFISITLYADIAQVVKDEVNILCKHSNLYKCSGQLDRLATIANQYQNNPYRKYVYQSVTGHIYLIDDASDFYRILYDLKQSNLIYSNAFSIYVFKVLTAGE
jgi:hypothetical protein